MNNLRLLLVLLSSYLLLLAPPPSLALDTSENTQVSATVPSTGGNPYSKLPPTSPILLRPPNDTITSDPRPEFVWQQSGDQDGNTIYYTLYLDGVAKYLGISNLGNSSGPGYTARIEGGSLRLLPSQDLSEGSHSWYVIARDFDGNTASSTTWNFTIDRTPPSLTLNTLGSYSSPSITSDSIYTFNGPQSINFVIQTESYATVFLSILDDQGLVVSNTSFTTPLSGIYQTAVFLPVGTYAVLITALDRANLSAALPQFGLAVTEFSIPLPSFPPGISPPIDLPDKLTFVYPSALTSLPATISQLSPRLNLPIILLLLLAIVAVILLIFLWNKRHNLTLVDYAGQPVTVATVYHSQPHSHHADTNLVYYPNDRGQLTIPHLGRYSSLTIVHHEVTVVLSLCRNARHYQITC